VAMLAPPVLRQFFGCLECVHTHHSFRPDYDNLRAQFQALVCRRGRAAKSSLRQ
jgi:hypothetical protein